MMHKKSQVGPGITWFGAIFTIFFILALYIAFVLFLSVNKVLPDVAMSKILTIESVDKTIGMGDVESEQKFLYLLNYPVDNGDFRELVARYNKNPDLKDEVKKKALEILEKSLYEGRCFIFRLDNEYVRNEDFRVESRIYPELFVRIPENKNGNVVGLYFGKC